MPLSPSRSQGAMQSVSDYSKKLAAGMASCETATPHCIVPRHRWDTKLHEVDVTEHCLKPLSTILITKGGSTQVAREFRSA